MYVGVEYLSSAVIVLVRLAQNTALERTRRTVGCDWKTLDVVDYVSQNEYLASRHFGTLPIEGQVGRVIVNENSQLSAHGTRNMRMEQ